MSKNRALTLVAAFALAACQGEQGAAGSAGAQGPAGPAGTQGPKGDPGTSSVVTGTLQGAATFLLNGNGASTPASAVTVETLPPQVDANGNPVTCTTDATGAFAFANVPVGIYAVKFSGNGYTTATVDAVSVVAGKTAVANKVLVAANPLTVVSKVVNQAFGFDADVALTVAVSGGKGPYTVAWAPKSANPTVATATGSAVTADPNDATKATVSASIHTGTFATILQNGKVTGLAAAVYAPNADPTLVIDRAGFVPVSMQQSAQMTYNVDATITDTGTGWVKTVTVAVPTATIAQGNGTVPANTVVIAHLPAADGTTPAAFSVAPAGATLNDATSKWPWFVASGVGDYQLAALPRLTVANYVSADFTAGSSNPANCVTCHDTGAVTAASAKFAAWSNSAHGNHFFKYTQYDAGGKLQFKPGVTKLPTANPLMSWNTSDMRVVNGSVLPMTTWEFGMTGAEGAHYSSSCMGCHMTGYNAAVASNGADDVMKAQQPSWTFNPATAFTGKLFTASATDTGEPVTKKPEYAVLDAVPAAVKAFAGMQCEACHGPLGQHASTTRAAGDTGPAPQPEYDVAACAICHDKPTNHDRVSLWRQSGHANLEVAVAEGGVDTHGSTESCDRCHIAQGYVDWMAQRNGVCTSFKDAAGVAITDPAKFPPLEGPLLIKDRSTPGQVVCQVIGTASRTAGDNYLKAIGATKAQIQPITCAACHDAHSTEIRASGSTGNLPSGYKVDGAGSGALCMTCHNTRNGARGDTWGVRGGPNGAPIQNGAPVTAIGGPHEANQTDVYVGANAYWVNGYRGSRHLAVAETCVGCHMNLKPDSVTATNTNHTWKADATICKHCHGDEVNGEGLEGQYTAAVATTKAVIMSTVQTALRSGAFALKGTPVTAIDAPTAATVVVTDFVNGRSPAFKITYGSVTTPVQVSLGNFLKADGTTPFFDVLFGSVAKANWNFSLVQDGSKSIHNPSFVFEVLSVTQANVGGGTL